MSRSSFQLKGGGWYADGYCGKTGDGSGGGTTDGAAKSSPEKPEKTDKPEKTTGGTADAAVSKAGKESCSAATG